MGLWICPEHGLTGPTACCNKASFHNQILCAEPGSAVEPIDDTDVVRRRHPVTPPASTESKSLGEILADECRAVQTEVYGRSDVPWSELSDREKQSAERCAQAVEAAVSLQYKGEIVKRFGLTKRKCRNSIADGLQRVVNSQQAELARLAQKGKA